MVANELWVCVQSPGGPLRAWMEPFMELSRHERGYEGWMCSLNSAVVAYPA